MKYPLLVEIEITEDHAYAGRRDNCQECPLALALLDHFPEVFIDAKSDHATVSGHHYSYPALLTRRIDRFDTASLNNEPECDETRAALVDTYTLTRVGQ